MELLLQALDELEDYWLILVQLVQRHAPSFSAWFCAWSSAATAPRIVPAMGAPAAPWASYSPIASAQARGAQELGLRRPRRGHAEPARLALPLRTARKRPKRNRIANALGR